MKKRKVWDTQKRLDNERMTIKFDFEKARKQMLDETRRVPETIAELDKERADLATERKHLEEAWREVKDEKKRWRRIKDNKGRLCKG